MRIAQYDLSAQFSLGIQCVAKERNFKYKYNVKVCISKI